MDPNEALQKIREAIAATAIDPSRTDYHEVQQQMGERFCDHFEALDSWLSSGGFLPTDWQRGGDAS